MTTTILNWSESIVYRRATCIIWTEVTTIEYIIAIILFDKKLYFIFHPGSTNNIEGG